MEANPPRRFDQTVDDSALPRPDSALRPWLFIVYGNDRSRHIEVKPTPVSIGRGTEADVMLNDERVSKIHCTVRVNEQGLVEVSDHGSRNGTFVDGTRIETSLLRPHQELRVGSTVMRFEHKDPSLVKVEEEMFKAAVTDPLTGVPNRRAFEERAAVELARVARHGSSLALAFIDADHFKHINDVHGHPIGDAVLRELAKQINATRRAEDAVCRYGGEEFVVLLCPAGLHESIAFAERLRTLVEARPVEVGELQVGVTISVGVSAYRPGDTLESLIKRADEALYRAKERGRNRVEREI